MVRCKESADNGPRAVSIPLRGPCNDYQAWTCLVDGASGWLGGLVSTFTAAEQWRRKDYAHPQWRRKDYAHPRSATLVYGGIVQRLRQTKLA